MAKQTKVIHKMKIDPEVQHERDLKELETLLVENREILEKLFEILNKLEDHEVLNMVKGGLSESDSILYRILTAVESSSASKSIKNALLMTQLLGRINMSELEPVILKLNNSIEIASEYEFKNRGSGWFGLLKVLMDPQFIEGSNVLTQFVKGFGENADDLKKKFKVEDSISTMSDEAEGYELSKDESAIDEKKSGSLGKAAAIAAGTGAIGVAAIAIPAILSRR
ncbi:DUF1641 domain-containing protein [Lacicoccus alkaliphilus]|uniref:Uncharacterized conserved protein YjgD, DUF1641 family n=1 Tax=Lacicoccus alkaliphilus DSM 16010 TaxID=1123231 RepID=A0A1M7E2Q8_9BACL|nr:DUF1641 domain-containing protein [Salinicoccus alkaliphilus]SHL86035.1 Uncharacterized conserved protein YjgD, DUF1641 family [Salinicoccus alkaliphilus DSM 16010]